MTTHAAADTWHTRRQVVNATFLSSSDEEEDAAATRVEDAAPRVTQRPPTRVQRHKVVDDSGDADARRHVPRVADLRVRALCQETGRLHEALRREQARSAVARDAASAERSRAEAAQRAAGQAAFTIRQLQEELVAARAAVQTQAERSSASVTVLRTRLADCERLLAAQQRRRHEGEGGEDDSDTVAALAVSRQECRRLQQELQALRELLNGTDGSGGADKVALAKDNARLKAELEAARNAVAKAQRAAAVATTAQAASSRRVDIDDSEELERQLAEALAEAAALRRELAVARADAAAACADADAARAELAGTQADASAALHLITSSRSLASTPAAKASSLNVGHRGGAVTSPQQRRQEGAGGAAHVAAELTRLRDSLAALGRGEAA